MNKHDRSMREQNLAYSILHCGILSSRHGHWFEVRTSVITCTRPAKDQACQQSLTEGQKDHWTLT